MLCRPYNLLFFYAIKLRVSVYFGVGRLGLDLNVVTRTRTTLDSTRIR